MTPQKIQIGTPLDSSDASHTPTGGHWLGALFAAAVALALYLPTVSHQLVYDDVFLISPDLNDSMVPVVTDINAAFDLFNQEYWANINQDRPETLRTKGQALYRPLTVFLWGITLNQFHDHDLSKPFDVTRGAAYHWINVIVNMLVVLLLHRLVLRLFGSGRLALLAALIYALHPLHSEAVAYVAGLSDQLAALTVVAGVLLFERATRAGGGSRLIPTVALTLTLFIGLLAKESAVLLLAVCALTDVMWWLGGRAVGLGRRLAIYGSMLVALGAHIWLRYLTMGYLQPSSSAISRLDNVLIDVPTTERVFNSLKLLAKYVWLVLWPKDLSIDYSFSAITVSPHWTDPEPLAGTILVAAMLILGLAKLRRSPALGWGLLMFTGCAIFTSNMIMPIGTVFAERLMYLPTLGAAVALAVVCDRLLGTARNARPNPLALVLVVVALGALGQRTYTRNQDFKDSLTLFKTAEAVTPKSARVQFQLGNIYAQLKLFDQAVQHLERSLELDPKFIIGAIRLGEVYLTDRNFDKAEQTFSRILKSIDIPSNGPEAAMTVKALVLRRRADTLRAKGDLDAAQRDLEAAMSLGLDDTARSAKQLAYLLHGQDRYEESIPIIQRGLQSKGEDATLLLMLTRAAAAVQDEQAYAAALARLEDTEQGRALALSLRAELLYEQSVTNTNADGRDRAMAMFDDSLALNDRQVTPYYYRGRYMVERTHAYYDAIIQYDNALERDPEHGPTLLYKAMVQLQVNDAEGALETLKRLELINPGVVVFSLMSEAYFKLGDLSGQEEMKRRLEELGKEPLVMALNRAKSFLEAGQPERAMEILEAELLDPDNAQNQLLQRSAGLVQLELKQCDAALASFERQELSLAVQLELEPDLYLAINKARALMCLDRLDEAAAQLDLTEATLESLSDRPGEQTNLRVSLLRRRAELALLAGDPQRASDLAAEGIELTQRRHPGLFDISIEAYVAQGDLEAAVLRTREASTLFFGLDHYPVVLEALDAAVAGDTSGALTTLAAAEPQAGYRNGKPTCERIAGRLRG
ncbi:MAG: hypothetical protein DRQ55_12950 [Planctomycetota bacterium]|nr:MAG: hypothetical protein DRQ55_12950 [Planctomycetota bacterium]